MSDAKSGTPEDYAWLIEQISPIAERPWETHPLTCELKISPPQARMLLAALSPSDDGDIPADTSPAVLRAMIIFWRTLSGRRFKEHEASKGLLKEWLALDAGAWAPIRHANEKAELIERTRAAVKELT